MTMQSDSIASELVRWMEIPRQPHVFALGNFARQVTFASQQARAFNLIWALFKSNRLTAGQRVAVVGAGLGGLTATVAALAKGCQVDLFEHASQPCPLQRGNDIRFIHPNILRWPEDDSDKPNTDFPFLNWTAANVRGVIKQIDLQWNMRASKDNRLLRRFFNYRVNRLYASPTKSGPQKPWLSANRVVDGAAAGDEISDGARPGYVEFAYDCVVLAVGFGEERAVAGVPFLSYWENDSLHQETGRGQRSILVSGAGDGGLIDALRLRLQNFDHAEFVREFLNIADSKNLVDSLREIENDLRPQASTPDISLQLQSRYDALTIPTRIEEYFRRKKRTDTTVTLNSPAAGPLSFKASLLNRFATHLAMRYADLHYLSGKIIAEKTDAGSFNIALERDDIRIRESRSFDVVIVRHGPENVIRRLVPDDAITEMQAWWETRADITTNQYWQQDDPEKSHRFFRGYETEILPAPNEVLDLALATFDSAYREFRRESNVQSVGVGEHDGKASFIVTLKPGALLPQPKYYAGWVLVQYVAPPLLPVTEVAPQVAMPGRRLPVGVGIYNYDIRARFESSVPADPVATPPPSDTESSDIATLGCFARDAQGDTYLITANYVVGLERKLQPGDRLFIEGESPERGNLPIARMSGLRLFPALNDKPDRTGPGPGIAYAKLEPGVVPDYEPLGSWKIERTGIAMQEDRVAKVGRTSGLTIGRVSDIGLTIRMSGPNQTVTNLVNCIEVKSDNDKVFSLAGDGGAAMVREDGALVGLLIGMSGASRDRLGTAIVAGIDEELSELGLSLLTSAIKVSSPSEEETKPTKSRKSRTKDKAKP